MNLFIRTRSLPLLVLVVTILVTPIGTQAAPGFYPLTSPNIPVQVQQAADSVFEIFVLDAQAKKVINLKTDRESFEQKISNAHLNSQIKSILHYQINFCLEHNIIENCDIYTDTAQGSGFLLQDGKTLWTNFHVVDEFVTSLAQLFHRPKWIAKLTLKNQNLPIFVFDNNGNLVFVAAKDADRATVSIKPFKGAMTIGLPYEEFDESSDFVQIQLSRAIGRPLPVAESGHEAKLGDKIFIIGYPTGTGPYTEADSNDQQLTDLHARWPFPDAPGGLIRVSSGEVLPIEMLLTQNQPTAEQIQIWKKQSTLGFDMNGPDYYQMIASNADTIFGCSGGPILNGDGQVVGMNAGGKTKRIQGGTVVEVDERGIRLLDVLKKLMKK